MESEIKKVINENYILKKQNEELKKEINRLRSANELYTQIIGANQYGKSFRECTSNK